MHRYSIYLICILSSSVLGCAGTKKLARPMESYNEMVTGRRSVISIPVELGIKELERSLNAKLDGVIYEDNNLRDDNLAIKAVKNRDLFISVDSQAIRYRVPLDLLIKYNAGFTVLSGEGEIALDMVTRFDIKANWALETTTEILEYEWLRQPRLSMGGINVPISFIANLILNNGKKRIAGIIDEQVANNVKLDQLIASTWEQMYKPMLVSPEYNTWLVVNPSNIGLSSFYMEQDSLATNIIIEGYPSVVIGNKPGFVNPSPLPLFTRKPDTYEGFLLNIGTEISYDEAESLAKQQIVGETYTYGRRSVTVEDIELYGQGDQVIVNTQLSGSYNGNIYLQGRPAYNARRNTIELKNLDFTLDTRNFLFKSAGWLLRGPIRNGIEDNMNFLLDANLAYTQEMLQNQLDNYLIAPGVKLRTSVNELGIREVLVVPNGLYADVFLTGDLKIVVDRLELDR